MDVEVVLQCDFHPHRKLLHDKDNEICDLLIPRKQHNLNAYNGYQNNKTSIFFLSRTQTISSVILVCQPCLTTRVQRTRETSSDNSGESNDTSLYHRFVSPVEVNPNRNRKKGSDMSVAVKNENR